MNEKGNALFLCITLLLIFSIAGLHFVQKRVHQVEKDVSKQRLLLCAKLTNGKTMGFINYIASTNITIATLTTAQTTSLFIPGYGQIASESFKQLKKFIQKSQVMYLLSFMNFLRQQSRRQCTFSPLIYRTPYKLSITNGFKRDLLGQTIKRGLNWNYVSIGAHNIIINQFNMGKRKIKTYFASKAMHGF